ncbi:MAG TPA: LapA family protein [bacterium]|nr:LapA family protein [bacterium]
MGLTVLWLLLVFIAATVFALSNSTTVTVNFWQWPVYTGPLALVVIGAGVCGALLTYLGSLVHHMRQAQQIRSLRKSIQARETPMASPPPGRTEETHRPF